MMIGRAIGACSISGWRRSRSSRRSRFASMPTSDMPAVTRPVAESPASFGIARHTTSSGSRNQSSPKSSSPVCSLAASISTLGSNGNAGAGRDRVQHGARFAG